MLWNHAPAGQRMAAWGGVVVCASARPAVIQRTDKRQDTDYDSASVDRRSGPTSEPMPDLHLDFALHQFECPHCKERTRHSSPGGKILFGKAKCEYCGREFLIVQNQTWPGDDGSSGPGT
jgi:hypothetical protein